MTTTAEYLRRTRRGLRAQSPLVRRTDRLEARLFTLLVTVLVVMVPVAVVAASSLWTSQLALAQQQQSERVSVTATLDSDPVGNVTGWGESAHFATAPVTWTWGTERRHADVTADGDLKAGEEVAVWVDARSGEHTLPPLTDSAAKFSSVLAGISLWTFSAVAAVGLFALARWRVELRRSREWSRDIEAFLGSTSSY